MKLQSWKWNWFEGHSERLYLNQWLKPQHAILKTVDQNSWIVLGSAQQLNGFFLGHVQTVRQQLTQNLLDLNIEKLIFI